MRYNTPLFCPSVPPIISLHLDAKTPFISHYPPPPFHSQLWGKLETLGLGTALKIMLFSSDEEGKKDLASLSRNELIALVNTAAQLSKSVGSVPEWRWLGNYGVHWYRAYTCKYRDTCFVLVGRMCTLLRVYLDLFRRLPPPMEMDM